MLIPGLKETFIDTPQKIKEVTDLSDYMNGRIVNTYPHGLINQCGPLSAVFTDIEKYTIEN